MNITNVVNSITEKLNSAVVPGNRLPALLLKCTSLNRPGLSAYKTTCEIIINNKKLGIPDGPNPDGSDNLINAFVYNIVKTIFKSIKNDAFISSCTPAGTINCQGVGTNGGGTMHLFVTNIVDSVNNGIIT